MRNIPSFSSVLRSENTRVNATQNALKPGQMLPGKVLELYPNQRAAIQLGGSQVVAQLETALASKQNYLFQVTSVGDVIRLKKISDVPLPNNRPISDQIMQQLGLNNNRQLKAFIQQLVSQNIAFTYKDGQAFAKLLEQFGGGSANRELLLVMTKQNFPLTEQVFQSLQTFQSSQLGKQINQLQQQLAPFNHNSLLSQLQQQLSLLVSSSPSQAQPMLQQFLHANQPLLEQVLSTSAPVQSSFLQQLTKGYSLNNNQTQEFIQQLNQILKQQLPFQEGERQAFSTFLQRFGQMMEHGTVTNSFKNVVQQQSFFQKIMKVIAGQDQQMAQQWSQQTSQSNVSQERQVFSMLQQMQAQQLSLPNQNLVRSLLLHLDATNPSSLPMKDQFLHMMKHFVQTSGIQDEAQLAQEIRTNSTHSTSQLLQSMMAGMTKQDRQVMQQWMAQAQPIVTQNQQTAEILQRINIQQIPQSEQSLVRQVLLSLEASDQAVNKDQFLQMVRQVLHQGEQVTIQTREMEHSLKQNLLLANQQSPDVANNQLQRMIQSLTGMQLNMVQDEPSITQQSFQIPGDRFGLAKDIRMQFEGKNRQNSEEIDSDFCSVLFHLDLYTLGETMITMSIQKRIVHISVYNDQQDIKPIMDSFTPILKEKLSDLNYQLSSISQKTLSDKEQSVTNGNHTAYNSIKTEGIDFRI
ncbi:hypothetical protein SAMN04487943_11389 [Gracilibacillus orientalis]|uniref:Hook-length control protein FliK n=1 Tax=Gracilibacillus orientalis TaxID=334253 RepID=A0A1I4PYP8_9BACI|nr:hypothetical protein [Gracilibacillus orientalis]SFM32570.1 hypothetical protein SAMN04487943_11389 [Gracilibacillus orientalis]